MATHSEKLAESLQVLKELQDKDNSLVFKANMLLPKEPIGSSWRHTSQSVNTYL